MNPDKGPGPEVSKEERAVQILLDGIEKSGFEEGFDGEEAEKHKELLKNIAKQIPIIGRRLLRKLRELTEEAGKDPGELTFFAVGGRVKNTPIKETTDFDLLIAAEHTLDPMRSDVTYPQRHQWANLLYEEIEKALPELGLQEDNAAYLELKGFGERTADEVEREEGVLKILEDKKG